MKFLVATMAMLISTAAFADFNGTWTGEGTVIDWTGNEVPCSLITVTMKQTATTISVTSGKFVCGDRTETLIPVNYQISGGKLMRDGSDAGIVSDHEWMVENFDPKYDDNYDAALNDDGTLRFEDMFVDQGAAEFAMGQLSKVK